jgi:hypothetical protein
VFDAELEHRSGCGGSVDVAELVDAALEVRSTMAISAEASRLLQGYYIMSRRYRGAAASINSRYAVPFLEFSGEYPNLCFANADPVSSREPRSRHWCAPLIKNPIRLWDRSLETLCSITASIAALNGRPWTHVLDAVYAIALYEESLTDIHGRSVALPINL